MVSGLLIAIYVVLYYSATLKLYILFWTVKAMTPYPSKVITKLITDFQLSAFRYFSRLTDTVGIKNLEMSQIIRRDSDFK